MFYILHLKSFQIFYWIHFMEVFHSYPTSVRMHLHKFRYCHWNRKPDLFFFVHERMNVTGQISKNDPSYITLRCFTFLKFRRVQFLNYSRDFVILLMT